ncbi:MAG: hypothetical protein ACRDRG_18610 [Pseudonocardiaceae bacterium]
MGIAIAMVAAPVEVSPEQGTAVMCAQEFDRATADASVRSAARVRLQARRGLTIYFGTVVPLSAVFQVVLVKTGDPAWVIPVM